jgi:pimeloyl-ACP methyl ester carboxylesterase
MCRNWFAGWGFRWSTSSGTTTAAGSRTGVLVLWGGEGLLATLPALEIWKNYAHEVTGSPLPECGHFLAEEQPVVVVERLRAFFS